jgi:flagellar biosynthetic protein FliO
VDPIQPLLAIALTLGTLGGLVWVLRRKGWAQVRLASLMPKESRRGQLEVIDRLVLGPQHSLHLIRVGDRVVLIGLSPSGCNLLESAPGLLSRSRT